MKVLADDTQCDYRGIPERDRGIQNRCVEPAVWRATMYDHAHGRVGSGVYTLNRCSQHGQVLREFLADNQGYSPRNSRYRVLSVEAINEA